MTCSSTGLLLSPCDAVSTRTKRVTGGSRGEVLERSGFGKSDLGCSIPRRDDMAAQGEVVSSLLR